jgi:hypothetical protein
MISRNQKYKILLFTLVVLSVGGLIGICLRWISPIYFSVGLILMAFLMRLINPVYSDFSFEMKWEDLNKLIYLTPVWGLNCKEVFPTGEISIDLFKNDRQFGNYLIQPAPFPHRIFPFSDDFGLDKVNLLIISPEKVYQGEYYEEIPFGGIGVVLFFITKDQKVVFEVIRRKSLIPWYKFYSIKAHEKALENFLGKRI